MGTTFLRKVGTDPADSKRHVPEGDILRIHRQMNLKCYTLSLSCNHPAESFLCLESAEVNTQTLGLRTTDLSVSQSSRTQAYA